MSVITNISNMVTTKKVYTKKIPLIVGDIHGMYYDLIKLLTEQLDFYLKDNKLCSDNYHLFAVGDLIDKGEDSLKILDLEIDSTIGNHDWKVLRYLAGRTVSISDGHNAIRDLENMSKNKIKNYIKYYLNCPLQFIINDQFVVTHGAMLNDDVDKKFRKALNSNVYGCPTKETRPDGEPVRGTAWRDDYNLPYICVYGHTPVREVDIKNKTINIDTGAAFGNKLTAYDPLNNLIYQIKTTRPITNTSSFNPF
jgi:protein phosphatase